MNTIKIEKRQALLVAHRGASGLERENSIAAFIAAGNRSYFGIETDVHKTSDGQFVLMHDGVTSRVSSQELTIADSTAEELSKVRLYGYDNQTLRADLCIPTLRDYISICKHYEKTAVLELKSDFTTDELCRIIAEFEAADYLSRVIFISFLYENLVKIRELLPEQPIQYLTMDGDTKEAIRLASAHHMDLDVHQKMITKEFVDACHKAGIKVNVWTVNTVEAAQRAIDAGVDFVTTNILE